MKKNLVFVLFFSLILAAGILLGLLLLRTPPPNTGTDPAAFSAVRAKETIAAIAKAPHSVLDSEAHEAVYSYLCAELRSLGLEPVTTSYPSPPLRYLETDNPIKNISATMDGASDNAILLVAHYDSAYGYDGALKKAVKGESFGACDDGYGIATLLETLRALKALGKPLQNDVIVLFTDSEETGCAGAEAELKNNLAAYKNVRFVMNLEARGVRGPALMFETGAKNAAVTAYYARHARSAASFSFATAVYSVMPNDTDLTNFKNYGFQGLNFAVIDGMEYYHTAGDSLSNVDLGSLQHYGNQVLSVTRSFAFDGDVSAARFAAGGKQRFLQHLPRGARHVRGDGPARPGGGRGARSSWRS